jgi:hypothetical protein
VPKNKRERTETNNGVKRKKREIFYLSSKAEASPRDVYGMSLARAKPVQSDGL